MSSSNSSANPYQAPGADISNETSSETYQPKIFTSQGRIGRLRYLAYALASYLVLIPFAIIGAIVTAITSEPQAALVITILGYIPMMIFAFMFAKRRLNDLNQSGWLGLLFLVPIANIGIVLWLLFGKGSQENNKYGPAPRANSTGVKVTACLMIIVPFIILAAVALPAYNDYVERAKQSQQ